MKVAYSYAFSGALCLAVCLPPHHHASAEIIKRPEFSVGCQIEVDDALDSNCGLRARLSHPEGFCEQLFRDLEEHLNKVIDNRTAPFAERMAFNRFSFALYVATDIQYRKGMYFPLVYPEEIYQRLDKTTPQNLLHQYENLAGAESYNFERAFILLNISYAFRFFLRGRDFPVVFDSSEQTNALQMVHVFLRNKKGELVHLAFAEEIGQAKQEFLDNLRFGILPKTQKECTTASYEQVRTELEGHPFFTDVLLWLAAHRDTSCHPK